jgi:type I site-specific restriction endonuclease
MVGGEVINTPEQNARRDIDADLEAAGWHCQRKVRRAEFSAGDRELGRSELTPLGECRDAVEREMVP